MTSLGHDIKENNPGGVRLAATRAGLRPTTACHQLFIVAEQINFISDLNKTMSCVKAVRPIHMVVDIGSNDLACMTMEDEEQCQIMAKEAVEQCRKFVKHGAGSVAIFTVIPRAGILRCSPETFEANQGHYNKALRSQCWAEKRVHLE